MWVWVVVLVIFFQILNMGMGIPIPYIIAEIQKTYSTTRTLTIIT